MFWNLSRSSARPLQDRDAATEPGVINRFDPDRPIEDRADPPSDPLAMAQDCLYGNDGTSHGATTYIQAFVRMGPVPCVEGEAGFITVSGGPRNWLFNAARVNFHSGAPVTAANLVASVTTGITLSADTQTIAWDETAVPSGATYAATNLKYGQGESNSYSSTNVIPAGELARLPQFVMSGKGEAPACLTDFGEGTLPEDETAPDLDGKLCLAQHGQRLFIRTTFDETYDYVRRVALDDPSYDYNSDFQFISYVRIPVATSRSGTVGAFLDNYNPTPGDPDTLYIENDNSPAYQINGVFQGGNHGILAWRYAAAAHGKVNADLGSKWATGGKTYTLARCPTTGQVVMAAPISGGVTDWVLDSVSPGSAVTFTHVSGATNTADIVTTGAPAQVQLYPSLQGVTRKLLVDGGRLAEANGVYSARQLRIHVAYRIPNVFRMYEWLWARVGSSTDIAFNDPSVESQVRVQLEYMFDAYGVTTVRYENEALQGHNRTFMWPSQHQALTRIPANSETLHFIMPGVNSFQSGLTQSGGSALDFSDWADITSNTLEYYAATGTWKAGSWWSDNVQRPPRVCAFEVRSSGGTPLKRYVMVNSATKGRTAANDYSTIAHFLSGSNKSYMATAYDVNVSAGDKSSTIGAWGFIDPSADPEADISFAFPTGNGEVEWVWYTTNASLSSYAIPAPSQMQGRNLQIVNRSASATVSINGDVATVSTTGPAFITFRAA